MPLKVLSLCTLIFLLIWVGGKSAAGDEESKKVIHDLETELGVFVYPKGEQDSKTQASDSLSCYDSAGEKTGIDPRTIGDEAVVPGKVGGGAVKGAAGGALEGAALGAILGDASKGAAVGAARGAMRGLFGKKKAAAAATKEAEQRAAAADNQKQATFKRAFSACMDARNYSVQ